MQSEPSGPFCHPHDSCARKSALSGDISRKAAAAPLLRLLPALAGSLAFLGRRYGLPRVISGHNNYFLWGPGEPPPRVLITVGEPREDVEKSFEDVRLEATHAHPLMMPYENNLPILVARRPRRPLDQIWPLVKRFI